MKKRSTARAERAAPDLASSSSRWPMPDGTMSSVADLQPARLVRFVGGRASGFLTARRSSGALPRAGTTSPKMMSMHWNGMNMVSTRRIRTRTVTSMEIHRRRIRQRSTSISSGFKTIRTGSLTDHQMLGQTAPGGWALQMHSQDVDRTLRAAAHGTQETHHNGRPSMEADTKLVETERRPTRLLRARLGTGSLPASCSLPFCSITNTCSMAGDMHHIRGVEYTYISYA